MKEDKRPFCVRYIIYSATIGIIFQFIFSQTGFCSTGARVPVSGERLVKEQLSHDGSVARPKPGMKTSIIQPGDNLCEILVKNGLSRKDALYIAKKADKVCRLTKLKPGTVLELYFSPDGTGLHEVDYTLSSRKKVVLYNGKVMSLAKDTNRSPDPVRAASVKPANTSGPVGAKKAAPEISAVIKPPVRTVSTRIAPSVNRPASPAPEPAGGMKMVSPYNCGLPPDEYASPEATYELLSDGLVLSPAFPSWDTAADQRSIKPDTGSRAEKKHAASSKRQKQKKRDSRLAGKAQDYFLRAPLSYRRVTSNFSYSRINPITYEEQPHLGIDYSAPSGTPVYSIGPGRVLSNEWSGGYGKTVRILHNNGYISQYAHLCRFARKIAPGKMVRKGEVIGYVGSTGLATGPHLDFRVTYRGSFINPVKMEDKAIKISSSGKTRRSSRG